MLTILDLSEARRNITASFEGVSTLDSPSPELVQSLVGLPTAAGVTVTRARAIRCVSFLAAVKMLANDIAKMPLPLLETTEKAGKQSTRKAISHPLYPILKDVPNPWMTAYQMAWSNAFNLITSGNFYVQKIKDQAGTLTGLMPLNPWAMVPRWDFRGPLPIRTYDYQEGANRRTFANEEIWTCSHMGMVGTDGQAIIALAKDALSIMIASDETAGGFFKRGLNMHGFLTSSNPDMVVDEKQAQDVVDRLGRSFSGSSQAGGLSYLPGGVKYEKMSFTAVEGQLLESRKWNAQEIARLLGGAPLVVKLGYGESNSTYASSAAFLEEYFSTALLPITRNIEQSITRDLLDPKERATLFAKHDADVILRGSPRERAERDKIEIESGKKSPNEARIADDLDPVVGLDYYHVNQNCIFRDGELITVGVRGVGTQDEPGSGAPPDLTPNVQPPDAQAPPKATARLQAIAASMAERILRKETKSGGQADAKYIAEVLNISVEKAEAYCQSRKAGEITDAKAALIALATEE